MFKHMSDTAEAGSQKTAEAPKESGQSTLDTGAPATLVKDVSPAALRELLEKNLKWSQIIYEQNRRINSKLFWTAVASWVRILVIVVPLILAYYFLTPMLNQMLKQYNDLLPLATMGSSQSSSSTIQDLLKVLPLGADQQAKLKAILNK
jgi:hypothetical protein